MGSIWNRGNIGRFGEELRGDAETDVLVIGGGMAGILCAHALIEAGAEVMLVERGELMGGVSGRTTAKITAQHGLCYHELPKRFGKDKARLYLRANLEAVEKYRNLCGGIDCAFEEKDSFVYAMVDSSSTESRIKQEYAALRTLGYHPKLTSGADLPFPVAAALGFVRQAQFDPLAFSRAVVAADIARGLRVCIHTNVRELVGVTAVTDGGRVSAKRIVVATHFPFINKHGSYFLKMYQQRSYVVALEVAARVNGMYIDGAENGLSFRDFGDLLLLGGGGHRTGKTGGGFAELERFARRCYPAARVKCRFATQDCMTLDGVPYIGRYSARTPNMYVATGFNKWGMTSSMVAAYLLSDLIQGKKNPYEEVFSPSRSILRPQLAVNACEALVGWLTPTSPRCPHLGCALKWNPAEHTWDCPCHGSRFAEGGELLDGPATGELK